MESKGFEGYLSMLRDLSQTLEQLTKVQGEKTEAVRQDELEALNECMKREQALSMTLRGLEQKRAKLLAELELTKVPLDDLPQAAPEGMGSEAKQVVEELRQQYQLFQAAAEVARNTLECNLHEVEKILEQLGKETRSIPGYQGIQPDLPDALRTDFRA